MVYVLGGHVFAVDAEAKASQGATVVGQREGEVESAGAFEGILEGVAGLEIGCIELA